MRPACVIRDAIALSATCEARRACGACGLTGHDCVRLGQPAEHVLDEAHLHARLHVAHGLAQDAREHTPDLRLRERRTRQRASWHEEGHSINRRLSWVGPWETHMSRHQMPTLVDSAGGERRRAETGLDGG